MTRSPHKTAIEAVRRLVAAMGGTANVLSQVGRLYGTAGLPDLWIQLPARYGVIPNGLRFWVEIKAGRDRLSSAQREFKEREEALGGKVVVGGIDAVIEYLGLETRRPE